MSTVLLEVVTPDRVVLSQQVSMVSLRSGYGELGILPKHAPLATTVKPGIVRIKQSDGESYLHVTGGFLEILPDRITILADAAELAENIDVDRARKSKDRAESRLNHRGDGIDVARAEASLRRALDRLQAAELAGHMGHVLSRKDG